MRQRVIVRSSLLCGYLGPDHPRRAARRACCDVVCVCGLDTRRLLSAATSTRQQTIDIPELGTSGRTARRAAGPTRSLS